MSESIDNKFCSGNYQRSLAKFIQHKGGGLYGALETAPSVEVHGQGSL